MIRNEENIFLGNKQNAENHKLMKNMNIQRILSIGYKQINEKTNQRIANIYYKDIPLRENREELIPIFNETHGFLFEAQKYEENVLINCNTGKTLTTVVFIAFLIKKYRITTEKAFNVFVEKERDSAVTNTYRIQLKIWQKLILEFNINNHRILKHFLFANFRDRYLRILSEIHSGYFRLHHQFQQTINNYNNNISNFHRSLEPHFTEHYYKCNKCLARIFIQSDIVSNTQQKEEFVCQYIYVMPQPWNTHQIGSRALKEINFIFGAICCFQCNSILGEYNWEHLIVCGCPLHCHLEHLQVFRYISERVVYSPS